MSDQIGIFKRKRDFALKKYRRYRNRLKQLWARNREAKKDLNVMRATVKGVRKQRLTLSEGVELLRDRIKNTDDPVEQKQLQNRLDTAIKRRDEASARVKKLNSRINRRVKEREQLRAEIKRATTKKRYWGKRIKFTIAKLVHFRELRKQRRQKRNPTFKPWMANGSDYRNCNQATRNAAARMVVTYGLTITSMARTYVPPGGSTTSYHLSLYGATARAVDAAGSWEAMVNAQTKEYARFNGKGNKLELFGPDNDKNLKNGAPLHMPEGTPLEDLHDTHVHSAQ